MSAPFRAQIRKSLADPNLQAALDKNARQRVKARRTAFASLAEDLESLRQRAHTVRADVIANHERYLTEFITRAQNNGLVVHRAADSAEARRIVLEIAKTHGARLIAKSKTMVSEEIKLNRALEAAGIRAVETDLGEYIVQLRGESPSHIITPAVHLRRRQVGETFHEKLGTPLTDDISTMTDAARAALREIFLSADIGLSGVNFGVVEDGAICIVTNEGNGRMVTTVPPVHIALMGIERLAPTYDDLALLLALLPRSATGQTITVYTQIIRSPRQAGELDGAQDRHLVLVDDGRSAIRGTPLNDTLMCIRCGACLNACPIFRELGGHAYVGADGTHTPYPGPIGSALSPALFGAQNFGHLAQACTICGFCKENCPVDIDLPGMLLRVRAGMVGEQKADESGMQKKEGVGLPWTVRWGLRGFAWFASKPERFTVAQKIIAALGRIWSPRSLWISLPALTGWGYSKDFPRPAIKPFRQRWAERVAGKQVSGPQETRKQVSSEQGAGGTPRLSQAQPAILPHESPVSRFQAELEALSGIFVRTTEAELAERILTILRERREDAVMAWDDDALPDGLADALRAGGITIYNDPQPQIRVGISGAVAGIAETGTLVIPSGVGKLQSASLLPETHLAILRAADILPRMVDALKRPELRTAAAVALVSGPSRTADIEMTLTIGVHGPGEVFVFCV